MLSSYREVLLPPVSCAFSNRWKAWLWLGAERNPPSQQRGKVSNQRMGQNELRQPGGTPKHFSCEPRSRTDTQKGPSCSKEEDKFGKMEDEPAQGVLKLGGRQHLCSPRNKKSWSPSGHVYMFSWEASQWHPARGGWGGHGGPTCILLDVMQKLH
jgi:hypothetical protein